MRVFLKKLRNESVFTLLGVLVIGFSLLNPEFFPLINENEKNGIEFTENKIGLETSINSGKIHIKNNWSDAVRAGIATGSGTFSDPYIIKDLIIDGGGTGAGILIEDSKNFYFRIENNTIFNSNTGIKLILVNNGTIYRNNCSFNTNGISVRGLDPRFDLDYLNKNNTILENIANNNTDNGIYLGILSDDSKIIGNTVNNNKYGIYLERNYFHNNLISDNHVNGNYIGILLLSIGNNSVISNNTLYNNEVFAISFQYFGYNLTNNLMKGSGLGIGPSDVEYMSLVKIDTSNLVNNKHVYYYINRSNLRMDDFINAGQIYLINSTNSIIAHVDVSNSTIGISLFHSNNITVKNTISSNNEYGYGVWLSNTNVSKFLENTLNNNWKGILLEDGSKNNVISGNDISFNWQGVEIQFYCDNNTISDNHLNKNYWGLWIRGGSYNSIYGNIIQNSKALGLELIGGPISCNYNTIFLNFFRENRIHIDISGPSDNLWNISDIGNYWDNYTGVDANGDGIGDTPHNISVSPLIQDFLPIVDKDPPEITIVSPSNNSFFGSTAPSFEIEVNEKYLDIMWYTLDGGLNNHTFIENGTIDQTMWNTLPSGQIRLRFYAIDKVGNIAYEEVVVIKQKEAAIPGYNPLLLLGITILFCFTLIKIVTHERKKIK